MVIKFIYAVSRQKHYQPCDYYYSIIRGWFAQTLDQPHQG